MLVYTLNVNWSHTVNNTIMYIYINSESAKRVTFIFCKKEKKMSKCNITILWFCYIHTTCEIDWCGDVCNADNKRRNRAKYQTTQFRIELNSSHIRFTAFVYCSFITSHFLIYLFERWKSNRIFGSNYPVRKIDATFSLVSQE